MRVFRLALRRLAASLPTLVLILAGMFLLLQLAPGDTVDALMAQIKAESERQIAQMRIAAEREISAQRLAAEMELAKWKANQEAALSRYKIDRMADLKAANGSIDDESFGGDVRMGGKIG